MGFTTQDVYAGASTSLTTSYSRIAVSVPDKCYLGMVHIGLTSIVTGTQVVVYVSTDSDGDDALTDAETLDINSDGATSGSGAVNAVVGVPYATMSNATAGTIYVNVKMVSGTATGVPEVVVETER